MELRNMEKLPPNVSGRVKAYIEGLYDIFGADIVSVSVYGSVTGSDYDPKTSDINIVVVLDDVSVPSLTRALKSVKKGLRDKITVPLFLTRSYIEKSLDTFPVEFIAMKNTCSVLFGEDVFSGIEVKKEDLRRECEYQLKGKILTIRQAYMEQVHTRHGLERLLKEAMNALIPVFYGLLYMNDPAGAPVKKEEVLRRIGEKFAVDPEPMVQVILDRKTDGRIGGMPAEKVLENIVEILEKVSDAVDNM